LKDSLKKIVSISLTPFFFSILLRIQFGENLAAGYKDFKTSITAWYNEEKQYNYNNPGFSGATGHFTQGKSPPPVPLFVIPR
jgi:hypothetical protein